MRVNKKNLVAVILATTIPLTALVGCSGKASVNNGKELTNKYGDTYPIQSDTKLTYWKPIEETVTISASNFGDLPISKEIMQRSGIQIEYIHPSLMNADEKFNLMIASGELPDIIEYSWANYAGGPGKAISDGIIIPLNNLIDAYAPNLKKIFEENSDVAREAKTNAGDYFAAGVIAIEPALNVSGGLIIRQDWLDDLGLEIPETIDEWYTVLKAFQEKKGATAPLTLNPAAAMLGAFTGAFETTMSFYIDDDKVHYGPMEEGYKEYLATMNQWYNEGLWDREFSTIDETTRTANMLNGVSGVCFGGLGGDLGRLLAAATEPGYSLSGAPYPTHKKGETPMFGQCVTPFQGRAAITTACKETELAMRFIDFLYSEEGRMLTNFGIEGVSYNMIDGYPTYTEEVTKNPDGLSMSQALSKYSYAGQQNVYLQDIRYLEQYASLPVQQEAWKRWQNTEGRKHRMPTVYISDEKQNKYATTYSDIETYTNEMYIKFISGQEPIEKFDEYVEKLKSMDIDFVLETQQEAYNNYLNR